MFKFCLIFFFHVEKGAVCFLPEKKKNKEMKLVPYITIILYRNVYGGSIIIQYKVASAFSASAFWCEKSTLYDKTWRWEIEVEIRFSWSEKSRVQITIKKPTSK